MISVEICIEASDREAVGDAVGAAYEGGASTVELCASMDVDGLTPSQELVKAARLAFRDRPGLMVMIRPRGGDFAYSDDELQNMRRHIDLAADAASQTEAAAEHERLGGVELKLDITIQRQRRLVVR